MSRSVKTRRVDLRCVVLLSWMAIVGVWYAARVVDAKWKSLRQPQMTQMTQMTQKEKF